MGLPRMPQGRSAYLHHGAGSAALPHWLRPVLGLAELQRPLTARVWAPIRAQEQAECSELSASLSLRALRAMRPSAPGLAYHHNAPWGCSPANLSSTQRRSPHSETHRQTHHHSPATAEAQESAGPSARRLWTWTNLVPQSPARRRQRPAARPKPSCSAKQAPRYRSQASRCYPSIAAERHPAPDSSSARLRVAARGLH